MIENLLPKYIRKWLWKNAFKFPNVIGFSEDFQRKITKGRIVTGWSAIRFYVVKKVDLDDLLPEEVIPQWIEARHWLEKHAFLTDVVEIGEVKALAVDKTKNFRPVELGVSVGNEAITAGSLGMLYESNILDYDPAGSNAHVLTDGDPSKTPEQIVKKNILQRGSYHGGKVPDDVVGQYVWHQQIYPIEIPTDCDVANGVARLLNIISQLFGRKSRFEAYVPLTNTIDYAIYKGSVEHILKIADDSIDVKLPFIGHLYAGSDVTGVLCSITEIMKARPDLKPLNGNWCEVKAGDRVKGCSFWCNFETEVIDANATLNVNYGTFIAIMTKAILVTNDGTIKGGWSGSGWFKTN